MQPLTIQSSHALRAMAVTAAMLAAYAAFSLTDRIERTVGFWSRRLWLTGGAVVLGLGMWSMHYFGALEDPTPNEAVYSLRLVLLSLLVATSGSWMALRFVALVIASRTRLIAAGFVVSLSLCALHVLGEHALRSSLVVEMRPAWLLFALVTGFTLSTIALWLVFGDAHDPAISEWARVGGSAIFGTAVAFTHMLALRSLDLAPLPAYIHVKGSVRGGGLGETALLVTVGLVMLLTLSTAAIDKRRYRELSQLNAALAASQQALLRSEGQLREANALLNELSIRDSLTGLYNRRRFDEVFDTEWRRSLRTMRPLSLLMIDVDCFKALNDSYGHQRGDECLREIARVLEEQPRRGHDIVARFGGEEFAVLLPGSDDAGAMRIAQKIRKGVEDLRIEHRGSKTGAWVTVSVGVCSRIPRVAEGPGDMVYEADMALYLAKQLGRNRVELREPVEFEVEVQEISD